MTTETTAPATTAEQPAEPIPTDPVGLYRYLSSLDTWGRMYTAERLGAQLGGTPDAIARACEMVESVLADVENADAIVRTRARLAEQLEEAAAAVRTVQGTLGELVGDLFDVEYAECQVGVDMRDFLDDAARALRAAAAFNPCPPKTNGTDR